MTDLTYVSPSLPRMDLPPHAFMKLLNDMRKPYEGKNPHLSSHPYCKDCMRNAGDIGEDGEIVRLLTCSRCKSVQYCNRECQLNDFHNHTQECRKIARLTKVMNEKASMLRRNTVVDLTSSEPVNLFETLLGEFWDAHQTKDYYRARMFLANVLDDIACNYQVKSLLSRMLDHRLGLLRLDARDCKRIRADVSFTLFRVNRDADCCAFVTHWLQRFVNEDAGALELHKASVSGEWLYGTADVYGDVLDVVKGLSANDLSFAGMEFVLALLVIKLRLIATHLAKEAQVRELQGTSLGGLLGDAMKHVARAMHDHADEPERIQQQRHMVDKYIRIVHLHNPVMIPMLVDPQSVLSQALPGFIVPGTPAEAAWMLRKCHSLFTGIPGVTDLLRKLTWQNRTN